MENEFARHLRGQGRFTADFSLPVEHHGFVLRSPYAHAEIASIDTRAALKIDGVAAVFTANDLQAAGIGSIPCVFPVDQADGSPMASPPCHVLAGDKVRHVGGAVAFIVAESRDVAANAAEEIEVDYRPLRAVTEARIAIADGAPQLWSEAPGNVCFRCEFGDREKTEAAFAAASHIVRRRISFPRVVVNPLETRSAIAVPDDDVVTIYTHSQGAQFLRAHLATILGIDQENLHVITPDVGGAFGSRGLPCPEQVLVAHAARALGIPVKWIGERSADGFVSDNQARDQSFDIGLALDDNGRFLAVELKTAANLGAYVTGYAPLNSTLVNGLPGPYDIATGFGEVTGAFTNTVQVDAYRGAGRAELVYPLERLIDAAAREIGMDRAEIRRLNLAVDEGESRTNCFGAEVENRDYRTSFERALEIANWPNGGGSESSESHLKCGIGIATYAVTAMGYEERIRLTVDVHGDVLVSTATQSSGQGHASVFAAAVAEALAIDQERVRVEQGDTRRFSVESMTAGSRSIPAGVPACEAAAQALIARGRELAATLMQTETDDVTYEDGHFVTRANDLELDLAGLVSAAGEAGLADADAAPVLIVEGSHDPGESTAPCGTHISEVEIDIETGALRLKDYVSVDDVGRVVNHDLSVGQICGGAVQGLGQAVLEVCQYDGADGQLLTGSLMDYALPRAGDAPRFTTLFHGTEQSRSHGVGEMGTIAAMPAIMNAVSDALARIGAGEVDAPATPEKIWRAVDLDQ